ncbi:2-hydroxychromene-2-carboxylate isomerase [Nitrogeniibacter mangrovi]|uniref:2-hydroxychromene-2-carboxylate isomerase n=1 Tax=Nitrogeniibacter mangrovi TaxID=2016596 RepID=A0A6C1B433_9RHOO|nr:2-hydroxychromene-2-carboxylate isomerase [Nitrogeniibacter mangrovi]QID17605.1 2-hydroxychromene-2-carboxylate isomerase [Nitrogeniibacter mangrovi]
MSKAFDYYFILNSPWSFLAATQLPDILHRTGAQISLKPVQMGPLLEATGGLPLAKRSAQRRAYRLQELARWARRLGVPLNPEPSFFPVDERRAVGTVLAAEEAGHDALALAEAFGAAIWVQNHNLADEAVLGEILAAEGLPALLLDQAKDARFDTILADNTKQAIEAGVFGVPTCVIGEQLFWGQDRLDFVEEALRD